MRSETDAEDRSQAQPGANGDCVADYHTRIDHDSFIEQMRRISRYRSRPDPDYSLAFLEKSFQRNVARPMKQLGDLAEVWAELLPDDLVSHTRLESLQRGVLRVVVDSAGRHYELDRLLRSGLDQELITRHKGTLTRIRVRVGAVSGH